MTDDEAQKWLTDDERALFSHEMMDPLRRLAAARRALFRTYVVADGLVTGSVEVFAAKYEVKRWFDEAGAVTGLSLDGLDTYQRMQDSIAELKEEHEQQRRKEADRIERARRS